MRQKETLFQIIQSFTKNEKRNFKQYASFHTIGRVNNYVLLFNAIAQQRIYNEDKIKQQLKHKIHLRNFRKAKSYLYEMVLKYLDFYHSNTSKMELKRLTHCAEIFFEKSLYNEASLLLIKAEKLANEIESTETLIEIERIRTKLIIANAFEGYNKEVILNIYKKQQKAFLDTMQKAEYEHLYKLLLFNIKQARWARNKNEIKNKYDFIVEHKLVSGENSPLTLKSELIRNKILGTYYSIKNDFKKNNQYVQKQLNIYTKKPAFIDEDFNNYVSLISNMAVSQLGLRNYTKALDYIDLLEKLNSNSVHNSTQTFFIINNFKMNIFIETCQFEKAINLTVTIKKGLEKYHKYLNSAYLLYLYHGIVYINFITENYKDCLLWLNKIINTPIKNLAEDIQSIARILNIMVHYEMKSFNHLPYIIRKTHYFLKNKKRLFPFEKTILNTLKKADEINPTVSLTTLFSALKSEILEYEKDPYEGKWSEYFDFISWLDSKIEGKKFAVILAAKTKINLKNRRKII